MGTHLTEGGYAPIAHLHGVQSGDDHVSAPAPGAIEGAAGRLQELGLTALEARVLVALLHLGSAGATDIARVANVHRPNVYPALNALAARNLAGRLPGASSGWVTMGRTEILRRLYDDQDRRVSDLRAARPQLEELLGAAEGAAPATPHVVVVRGPEDTHRVFERLLASAQQEVLAFNRGPYGLATVDPSVDVLHMLERGVTIRAIYATDEVDGPDPELSAYVRAGLKARVFADLPTKLVIVDRCSVLFAMMDPRTVGGGFPSSLAVDDAGLAATWTAIFDVYWARARRYVP